MFDCLKKKRAEKKIAIKEEEDFPRKINEVIVHCAATPDSFVVGSRWYELDVKEVRRWHVEERGWSDIGYHYFIKRDGTLQTGRPLERAGAHVRGRNKHSIGVCFSGSHSYTEEQKESLVGLYKSLRARFGLRASSWRCHNEFSDKDCPGFNVNTLQSLLVDANYDLNSI